MISLPTNKHPHMILSECKLCIICLTKAVIFPSNTNTHTDTNTQTQILLPIIPYYLIIMIHECVRYFCLIIRVLFRNSKIRGERQRMNLRYLKRPTGLGGVRTMTRRVTVCWVSWDRCSLESPVSTQQLPSDTIQ